jgi:NTE family protein
MPVFGVDALSYLGGGIVTTDRGPAGLASASLARAPGGTPRLSWPGRRVETAFVLGGGGNRGAVQVGMLRALTERGIVPDLLVGTSIGAINAAAFAGSPTIDGVYLAADVWRRILAEDVFPRGRFHGTWRFLERREAVYPIAGLRRVVAGFLRFERLEDSPIPLVVVASRLEDGAEEWLIEGPALDCLLASAALPGLFPVMELGGSHYFDGGVLDNVALSAAVAAGARRIFVLMCGSLDLTVPVFTRPYEAMFAALNMALHARLKRDLALVGSDVDVVVFEARGVAALEASDFSKTEELIDRGYQSAREVIDSYDEAVRERRSSRATPRVPDGLYQKARRALGRSRADSESRVRPANSP